MIDQHAAHERIRFEAMLGCFTAPDAGELGFPTTRFGSFYLRDSFYPGCQNKAFSKKEFLGSTPIQLCVPCIDEQGEQLADCRIRAAEVQLRKMG